MLSWRSRCDREVALLPSVGSDVMTFVMVAVVQFKKGERARGLPRRVRCSKAAGREKDQKDKVKDSKFREGWTRLVCIFVLDGDALKYAIVQFILRVLYRQQRTRGMPTFVAVTFAVRVCSLFYRIAATLAMLPRNR